MSDGRGVTDGPGRGGRSGEGALPPTSLVIPTRNRPDILIGTVESILEGDELPSELVVVDQSDVPDTRMIGMTSRRSCRIRYHPSTAVGLSRARNEGIERASFDHLVFTDDDVTVASDWFGTIVRALLEAGRGSLVTGQVFPGESGRGGFVPSTKVDDTPAVYEGRIGEDVIYPHNMAVHRSVFDVVGLFDPRLGAGTRFGGAEDNDFCFRLLEAGFRIHYVPEARIWHRAWRKDEDYVPLRWSYGRGQGGYYAKHLDLRDRHMAGRLVWEIQHRLRRLPRRFRAGTRRGIGELVYLAGLGSGVLEWLVTQRSAAVDARPRDPRPVDRGTRPIGPGAEDGTSR